MDVSSFVLLSHEQALRRQLDVAANNMANVSTAGYKREQAVFHAYVENATEAQVPDARQTAYVLDYGAVHDIAQGSFQATGNPLDVMIEGPGYLNIEMADGSTGYTRAGFIKVLDSGELATSGGQRLLDENGRPIAIPTDQLAQVRITGDGTVMAGTDPVGRLAVTNFDDENLLDARGDGVLTGSGGRTLTAAQTKLRSGGVEASNVEPVSETTHMVEVLRSYQTSQRLSSDLAEMRRRAIDRLSKLG
ncbi:flagellar hook-basal body protein [Novosphingobium colocasiae]|uniref:flagellar hook-basal body protein n=1 Tax=Novosphingobium colocasiae TaxID=1256513 RepID=UPI0035B0AD66